MIPDARNEEKIADIKHALETLEDDELEEYIDRKSYEDKKWLDAMYYAIEDQEDYLLEDWEEYLLYRLMKVEKYYFADNIDNYDY